MIKKVVEIESGAKNQVRGRPFEPGNKMGRGRPKGSRTRRVRGRLCWTSMPDRSCTN